MGLLSKDSRIQALRNCSLFKDLSRSEIARVANAAEDIEVEAGTVLCQEGDLGRELFVIVTGQADVTKGEKLLSTLGEGDYFGELALLDHATRTATVAAKSQLRFLVLSSEVFWPLIDASPKLAQELLRTVARRARTALADPIA